MSAPIGLFVGRNGEVSIPEKWPIYLNPKFLETFILNQSNLVVFSWIVNAMIKVELIGNAR